MTEHHQIEQALRECEIRYRTMFEQAHDAIMILDQGRVIDCNTKGLEMFGRTRDQVLGHSLEEFSPLFQPDGSNSKDKFGEFMLKALNGEVPFFEWISAHPDGSPIYAEISLSRVDLVGKVQIQAIMCNVTECHLQDQVLEESETRFQTLLNESPVAIGVSREGTGIYFNRKFVQMFGLENEEELLGRHVSTFFAPELQQESRERIKSRALGLRPVPEQFESRGLRADGSTFPMRVEVAQVKLADGMAEIGFLTDITEQKRAEEKIAQQASLLNEVRDAIIVRDLAGKILFWNKGAERMYGWTSHEAKGRDVGELFHASPSKLAEMIEQTICQGEWQGEIQQVTRDQRKLVVDLRCSLIRDKQGNPESILSINTDITERKQMEAQFMRAQRMESVGALAGGIAHDLNNILAPIMMSIDVLRQKATDPQSLGILETIAGNSQRGADIVRQLLSFARGLEGDRAELDPYDLIKNTESILKDTLPKNIRMELTLPDRSWKISGDATLLCQVLVNLCLNARDAMPRGGTLKLAVENIVLREPLIQRNPEARPGRYVVLHVKDTGTGIPADIADQIFEPFFTTKEMGQGTGLGLAMVMTIVKSHGGFVDFQTEIGKGTSFQIYFRAREIAAEVKPEEKVLSSLPRGKGELVLVVDDEASVLAVTSQTLQVFGYRTLTAPDGREAANLFARQHDEISVVLTDIMMPGLDGPETIRALKEIKPSVKIIVASGSSSHLNLEDLDIKYFLDKPHTAGALLTTCAIFWTKRSALSPPGKSIS